MAVDKDEVLVFIEILTVGITLQTLKEKCHLYQANLLLFHEASCNEFSDSLFHIGLFF